MENQQRQAFQNSCAKDAEITSKALYTYNSNAVKRSNAHSALSKSKSPNKISTSQKPTTVATQSTHYVYNPYAIHVFLPTLPDGSRLWPSPAIGVVEASQSHPLAGFMPPEQVACLPVSYIDRLQGCISLNSAVVNSSNVNMSFNSAASAFFLTSFNNALQQQQQQIIDLSNGGTCSYSLVFPSNVSSNNLPIDSCPNQITSSSTPSASLNSITSLNHQSRNHQLIQHTTATIASLEFIVNSMHNAHSNPGISVSTAAKVALNAATSSHLISDSWFVKAGDAFSLAPSQTFPFKSFIVSDSRGANDGKRRMSLASNRRSLNGISNRSSQHKNKNEDFQKMENINENLNHHSESSVDDGDDASLDPCKGRAVMNNQKVVAMSDSSNGTSTYFNTSHHDHHLINPALSQSEQNFSPSFETSYCPNTANLEDLELINDRIGTINTNELDSTANSNIGAAINRQHGGLINYNGKDDNGEINVNKSDFLQDDDFSVVNDMSSQLQTPRSSLSFVIDARQVERQRAYLPAVMTIEGEDENFLLNSYPDNHHSYENDVHKKIDEASNQSTNKSQSLTKTIKENENPKNHINNNFNISNLCTQWDLDSRNSRIPASERIRSILQLSSSSNADPMNSNKKSKYNGNQSNNNFSVKNQQNSSNHQGSKLIASTAKSLHISKVDKEGTPTSTLPLLARLATIPSYPHPNVNVNNSLITTPFSHPPSSAYMISNGEVVSEQGLGSNIIRAPSSSSLPPVHDALCKSSPTKQHSKNILLPGSTPVARLVANLLPVSNISSDTQQNNNYNNDKSLNSPVHENYDISHTSGSYNKSSGSSYQLNNMVINGDNLNLLGNSVGSVAIKPRRKSQTSNTSFSSTSTSNFNICNSSTSNGYNIKNVSNSTNNNNNNGNGNHFFRANVCIPANRSSSHSHPSISRPPHPVKNSLTLGQTKITTSTLGTSVMGLNGNSDHVAVIDAEPIEQFKLPTSNDGNLTGRPRHTASFNSSNIHSNPNNAKYQTQPLQMTQGEGMSGSQHSRTALMPTMQILGQVSNNLKTAQMIEKGKLTARRSSFGERMSVKGVLNDGTLIGVLQ